MPKLYTLSLCLLALFSAQAQELQWASYMASSGTIQTNYTAFLSDGSTIHAGYFTGTADLDSGPEEHIITASGSTDAYILKRSVNGIVEWIHIIGGATGFESIAGIKVDGQDRIYCAGQFEGSSQIPGMGVQSSLGYEDIFVLKLASSGETIWYESIGNPSSNVVTDFTLDNQGSIVLTGYFAGTLDFDPQETSDELTSIGSWDVYVLKLDTEGNYQWANKIGSSELDQAFQICTTPEGKIVSSFRLNGTSINNASIEGMPIAQAQSLCFIQLENDGTFEWLRQIPDVYASQLHLKALESDTQGNIIHAGVFTGSRDFDYSEGEFLLTAVTGYFDGYVAKINPQGNHVWAKSIGGYEEDVIQAIAIDQIDQIHLTGSFMSTSIDLAPGEAEPQVITRQGSQDFYQWAIDADGNYLEHMHLSSSGMSKGTGIMSNQSDEILVALVFNGEMQLNVEGETMTMNQASGFASLVFNQYHCQPNSANLDVLACGSYTSPSGEFIWNTNGDYVDVIPNAGGCDSVIIVHLMIQEIEAVILQADEALMASYDNAEYKWIDCGNNFQFIPGATDQFYTPSVNGTYAVQVTVNGCSEISECVDYFVASTGEPIILDKWHVYPNPNNGTFTIPKTAIREAYEIRIVDAYGKLIQRQRAISNSNIEVQFEAPPGVYHVQLLDKNNVRSTQIVKY
ncbi:MAG: hypothetical protein RLZZ262_1843 [Bacteroidota bacterium]|jgi:hypothetical protein